jgi:hypothetical protein
MVEESHRLLIEPNDVLLIKIASPAPSTVDPQKSGEA